MPFILNNIRGVLKGAAAWIFVIVGVAAFSVVGVPSLQNFSQKPAIKAGSVVIDQNEVLEAFNLAIRQEQAQLNRAYTREEALTSGLPQQIIGSLTSSAAIQYESQKMNLAMPRSLINEVLSQNPTFQNPTTGEFDQSIMQRLLTNLNLSPIQFERMMRRDLLQSNLLSALQANTNAPRTYLDVVIARQTERRDISWLSITDDLAGEAVAPTPEDLQNWYNANTQTYTDPEYRTFSMVLLRNADFQKELTIPEDELRATYDANRERLYETPEKRTLYQLTFDEDSDAALAVERLRQGTPFETIAIERGTTLQAATLTEASKADIVDTSVSEAAFAPTAENGAILDPIKGLFGSTIVQIVDISPKEVRSFEDVREELETSFLSQKTDRLVYDALALVQEGLDDELPLSEAAKKAGLTVTQVGPVDNATLTPGGAILNDIPISAIQEGFILEEGDEPEPMELEQEDGYAFVIVDEIIDPTLKPFEDVSSVVENAWKNDEIANRISKTADALAARIKAGESLESIAEGFERAAIKETIELAAPAHQTISTELHTDIFNAEKDAILVGNALGGSVKVIAQIHDISFNRSAINQSQFQSFGQFLGRQIDQELVEAYVQTLQQEYKVEINQPLIDRLFSLDEL